MTEAPVLWLADEEERASANVTRFVDWLERGRGLKFPDYRALWQWSVDDLAGFWESVWQFFEVQSSTPYSSVIERLTMPGAQWFPGARLNYAEHIFARQSDSRPALVYVAEGAEPTEIAWGTLRGQVGALAGALRELGVEPGDRVAAYLPNIPEAVVALLAVASVGAVWTACSPDFGIRSVVDRFGQVDPKVLIAADGYRFGGREHDRLDVVAQLQEALPTVQRTILARSLRPECDTATALDALTFAQLTKEGDEPAFEQVPFDHPLWVLFSSGTTGVPKGIVHGHGGIVVEHLKSLGLCLDLREGDRWLFYTSTSWMAWNYLVGGLLHGATSVLYDGSPGFPRVDALWRLAERTRASILGMGAAYVTGCQKADTEPSRALSLDALRVVIPTGSPLPRSGWQWLHEQVGSAVRIEPMCGGTDVCTAFFGSSPILPVRLGQIPCRWLGVHAEAYDASAQPVTGRVGEFVVTKPMPSMPLQFWNDPDGARLRQSYFDVYPGVWRQGDWITIDAEGSVVVWGRSDATLNRGGVRLGSAEIYSVVEGIAEIADSLVVGVELPDGDYYMPLFVVPVPGAEIDDELRARIAASLRRQLSPRHVPDEILEAPAIPRTKTGKKLEVPVKRILQGVSVEEAAAVGALDRPDAIEWFVRLAHDRRARR